MKLVTEDKPDIIIINGDLIENPIKLELVVINFIVFIINEIRKMQPNIRIILNTGNHDIIYTDNRVNFGNFVNIFSNTKNVTTVSMPRTFKLTNQLQLHVLPYSNSEVVSKFMSGQNFQQGYNIFVMHHNFDFIHDELYSGGNLPNTVIRYDDFRNQIDFGQYHIFNGHYHRHKEYTDKNFTIIGSLFQQTYSEKIMTISDFGKYFGYELIDFNNINDVKFTFVPYKHGICQLHYRGQNNFVKEYSKIKQHIVQHQKEVFYQIKIEDTNQKRDIIENKMKILRKIQNVIECKYIGTVNIDLDLQVISEDTSEITNFNLDLFYKDQIEQIFEDTKVRDKVIGAFKKIISN